MNIHKILIINHFMFLSTTILTAQDSQPTKEDDIFVQYPVKTTRKPLSIDNGIIVGLPEHYSPARFDQRKCTLYIGKKELQFPSAIHPLFVKISGSPFNGDMKSKTTAFQFIFTYIEHVSKETTSDIRIEIRPNESELKYYLHIDIDKMKLFDASVYTPEVGSIPIFLNTHMP